MPSTFTALVLTTSVVPPHSTGLSSCSASCPKIRWIFVSVASGLSILFNATTIGTWAALAWLIDSIVWVGDPDDTERMPKESKTEREARIAGKMADLTENEISGHLDELVRNSAEDALNAPLAAETDQLCGAKCDEHSSIQQEAFHLLPI